jgi:PAS domain S-box-containing protein
VRQNHRIAEIAGRALQWLRGRAPARTPAIDPRQEALATVIGTLPLRIIMVDREMRVLAASKLSAAGIGLPESEYLGRVLFEIDEEYFGPYRVIGAKCLQGETFFAPRVRARQSDGSDVWLRTEVTPWLNAKGDIGGLVSVSVEITDVLTALDASERSEQRLNMALEIADVHVWELDFVTQKIQTAGARDTFFDGSLTDEMIAADTTIAIHPEDRALIADDWNRAVYADEPYHPEFRINRQDGQEVWATCTTRLVRDTAGEPIGMIGAIRNTTARKATEAALVQARDDAEAANRAKSVFLATMSHEIRTPLNGVLGMAQAMAADELSPVQRDRLETVRQSGETLLVILNDLLDLSKIEAGKVELEVADFALAPLIESVRATFADVAAGRGLSLVVDVDSAAEGVYRGDATRLRQILFNLVANGLKFTEAGEVRLSVRREGPKLGFRISDTGMGIPADRLPRLFNKFEQADASTTRRFGGTGLGLAISRDLAALMGGDIEVESVEGAGSTFHVTVRLPYIGETLAPAPARPAPAPSPDRPLRILAAEDNAVNQVVLRALLEQAGIEPFIVDDGAACVDAWQGGSWDVILMDVQMPVMDGPSAARAIRAAERASGRRRTPIVALTANAMAHQVTEYAAAGMDGFIAKPIHVEELFAGIEAALELLDAEVAA